MRKNLYFYFVLCVTLCYADVVLLSLFCKVKLFRLSPDLYYCDGVQRWSQLVKPISDQPIAQAVIKIWGGSLSLLMLFLLLLVVKIVSLVTRSLLLRRCATLEPIGEAN